jgi:[ribosomal protein S5]-alanine N-acetyltransferase
MSFRDAFQTFPTLQTQRLFLRQFQEQDAHDCYRQLTDPQVCQFYGNPDTIERKSLQSAQRAIALGNSHFQRKNMIALGICLQAPDTPVIGRIALQEFQNQTIAELAYWLARPYWGAGLMSEALQAVLHFGFETLELHRLWAATDPRNLPSCRLLERNGLVREGVLRQATSRNDGWADSAIYAILKDGSGRLCAG